MTNNTWTKTWNPDDTVSAAFTIPHDQPATVDSEGALASGIHTKDADLVIVARDLAGKTLDWDSNGSSNTEPGGNRDHRIKIDTTRPPSVSNLSAPTIGANSITLSWSAPTNPGGSTPTDLGGLLIFRREESPQGAALCTDESRVIGGVLFCAVLDPGTGSPLTIPPGTTTWTDTATRPGRIYTYALVAVDLAGNESSAVSIELAQPLNVALVLDRSGSMNLEFAAGRTGIQVARGAAKLFLGILEARNSFRPRPQDKHQAAIVSFAEDVPDDVEISGRRSVFQGLLPVESVIPFEDVLANIEADVAQGRSGWTNIIGGLERAWLVFDPELDGTLNDTNRKHQILLLTDGEHNYHRGRLLIGPHGTMEVGLWDPYYFVSGELNDTGQLVQGELCPPWRGDSQHPNEDEPPPPYNEVQCKDKLFPKASLGVSSVSLARGIKEEAKQVLQMMAGVTPGDNRFLPVDGVDAKTNLEKVYVYMLTGMTGGVQNKSIDDDIGPNETKRHLVSVDSSMKEATFIATWADPRVQVEFILRSPDGTFVDPIYASSSSETIRFVSGSTYAFYHMLTPTPGPWELIVTAANTTSYSLLLIGQSHLRMAVDFDRLAYVANNPITVSAKVVEPDGILVTGAQVGGFVQGPLRTDELTLNDLGVDGDRVAGSEAHRARQPVTAEQAGYWSLESSSRGKAPGASAS